LIDSLTAWVLCFSMLQKWKVQYHSVIFKTISDIDFHVALCILRQYTTFVLSGLTRNNVRIESFKWRKTADRLLIVNTSYTSQNLSVEHGYQYRECEVRVIFSSFLTINSYNIDAFSRVTCERNHRIWKQERATAEQPSGEQLQYIIDLVY